MKFRIGVGNGYPSRNSREGWDSGMGNGYQLDNPERGAKRVYTPRLERRVGNGDLNLQPVDSEPSTRLGHSATQYLCCWCV